MPPIEATDSGILTDLIEELPKAPLSMVVTPSGMSIDVKTAPSGTAPAPMTLHVELTTS